MKKIIAWVKKHEYQWEKEDYRKACNIAIYVMVVIVVGLMITMVLFERFEWDEHNRILALAIWCYLVGVALGSGFTIKWADMRLKKTRKSVALGGKG